MTAPVSVNVQNKTKSLTQTGLRSISGIGTDRRAWSHAFSHPSWNCDTIPTYQYLSVQISCIEVVGSLRLGICRHSESLMGPEQPARHRLRQ